MYKVKAKKTTSLVTIITALIYTVIITGWHFSASRDDITIQAPGADNRPEGLARTASDVNIGEYFMEYTDISTSLSGQWTGFRGENNDNIIRTSEQINVSDEEYEVLWSVETGEGHAAPVIYNGRVYLLDYNEELSSDALRCFSLETGEELWRRWYRVPLKRNHDHEEEPFF